MNSPDRDIILLGAMLALFVVAYAMDVPRMSAGDLVVICAAGLIAIDFRLRGL